VISDLYLLAPLLDMVVIEGHSHSEEDLHKVERSYHMQIPIHVQKDAIFFIFALLVAELVLEEPLELPNERNSVIKLVIFGSN